MKLFKCANCEQLLYFENSFCERCKNALGFVPEDLSLITIVPDNQGGYRPYRDKASFWGGLLSDKKTGYSYCKNHDHDVCNWLVPVDSTQPYCKACELNHMVPNLANPEHLRQWQLIEAAKHRLIYTLLQLNLPLISKLQDTEKGLSFDFLTDINPNEKVLTGHENGLITLNIDEADDDKRELSRKQMNEPYRTLLGHFRHEVGHYYWDRLIADSPFLEDCRSLFGDERTDYAEALQNYYNQPPPANWNLNFISEYASSHPWEDWAETWAHYLHIMDTLETAGAFGISVAPGLASKKSKLNTAINTSPYQQPGFDELLNQWLPLTFAMNSLNRSMGQHDMYPFVIQPKVVNKLRFIHKVCYESKVN